MKKTLFIILSTLFVNALLAQDSIKFVPGISIAAIVAHTTNSYPISYSIDLNPNINVSYKRNKVMLGPVLGTRRISLPATPAPIFLKWGLNGLLLSYQRELLSGENTSFKMEYNFIYQFLNYRGTDYSWGEEYHFTNFLIQQTFGYVFDIRFGRHFVFAQHLGAGYGTGKYKLDYTRLPGEYDIQKRNKGLTTLIKLSIGYNL